MNNMSYCRFKNTLGDLNDCYDHIGETDELSKDEKKARIKLIQLCCDIALDFGEDVEKLIEEI